MSFRQMLQVAPHPDTECFIIIALDKTTRRCNAARRHVSDPHTIILLDMGQIEKSIQNIYDLELCHNCACLTILPQVTGSSASCCNCCRPPASCIAASITVGTHSLRGRPTRRMYLEVAGSIPPGAIQEERRMLFSELRKVLLCRPWIIPQDDLPQGPG